jgi:hypothetical protein
VNVRRAPGVRACGAIALGFMALPACHKQEAQKFHHSLFDRFEEAERRPAHSSVLAREEAVVDGAKRRVIFAHPPTRLIWTQKLPARAVLSTAIALKPEAWAGGGDGVVFRIGISDNRIYKGLYSRHVDPSHRPDDRRWIPVTLDLSHFGGWQWSLFYRPWERTWRLVFSTDVGPPGFNNNAWDWAIWAEPMLEWSQ